MSKLLIIFLKIFNMKSKSNAKFILTIYLKLLTFSILSIYYKIKSSSEFQFKIWLSFNLKRLYKIIIPIEKIFDTTKSIYLFF